MQTAIDAPKRTALNKKCAKCDKIKPISEYHRNPKNKDGYCGACKICRSAHAAKWYEANRERENARSAATRAANPEGRKETVKKSNAKRAGIVSQWQKDNPDKVRERNERWRKANLEKVRARIRRHRTRKAGGGGSHTHQEWFDLCAKYNDRCACCGAEKQLEADHVLPVSKGGSSNIDNIQPLCRSCNARKNNQVIDYR